MSLSLGEVRGPVRQAAVYGGGRCWTGDLQRPLPPPSQLRLAPALVPSPAAGAAARLGWVKVALGPHQATGASWVTKRVVPQGHLQL